MDDHSQHSQNQHSQPLYYPEPSPYNNPYTPKDNSPKPYEQSVYQRDNNSHSPDYSVYQSLRVSPKNNSRNSPSPNNRHHEPNPIMQSYSMPMYEDRKATVRKEPDYLTKVIKGVAMYSMNFESARVESAQCLETLSFKLKT